MPQSPGPTKAEQKEKKKPTRRKGHIYQQDCSMQVTKERKRKERKTAKIG